MKYVLDTKECIKKHEKGIKLKFFNLLYEVEGDMLAKMAVNLWKVVTTFSLCCLSFDAQ